MLLFPWGDPSGGESEMSEGCLMENKDAFQGLEHFLETTKQTHISLEQNYTGIERGTSCP